MDVGEEKNEVEEKPLVLSGKRERRKSQVYVIEDVKSSKGGGIPETIEGNGIPLNQNEAFMHSMSRLNSKDELLKKLHVILFGTAGVHTVRKRTIRTWSGFDKHSVESDKLKAEGKLKKFSNAELKGLMNLFGLQGSSQTKDTLVETLVEFIAKPSLENVKVSASVVKKRKAKTAKLAVAKKKRNGGDGVKKSKKKVALEEEVSTEEEEEKEVDDEEPEGDAKVADDEEYDEEKEDEGLDEKEDDDDDLVLEKAKKLKVKKQRKVVIGDESDAEESEKDEKHELGQEKDKEVEAKTEETKEKKEDGEAVAEKKEQEDVEKEKENGGRDEINDDEIKSAIGELFKDKSEDDLAGLTIRKVKEHLESKFNQDLSAKKSIIREYVMNAMES
uniref:DEK-C domain-containing protein n=1 Tax=Timspurckia oligopyrenoides TaxID=708627 RepID=A0A7S1EPI1_9RHOD